MEILQEAAQKTGLSIDDIKKIEEHILKSGNFVPDRVRNGLCEFCCKIGMVTYYFKTTPLETIARHIESILAAEVVAINRGRDKLDVDFVSEHEDSAMYLVNDDHEKGIEIERRLEETFPDYRLQSYRTPGLSLESHFRSYFVAKPQYAVPDASPLEDDINKVAAKQFIEMTTSEARDRYHRVIQKSLTWTQPYINVTDHLRDEIRIMVSVPQPGSYRILSGISNIINYYGLVSKHKYVEPFSNGKVIMSIYLDAASTRPHIDDLVTDISLSYVNPDNELSSLIRNKVLSAHEAFYAASAWIFTHQFLTGFNVEYMALMTVLKDRPELVDTLNTLRTKLVKDSYTEARILQTIFNFPGEIKKLYAKFSNRFDPKETYEPDKHKLDFSYIPNEIDHAILEFCQVFNRVVMKTNFFKKDKTSLAYRLDPQQFLDPIEYAEKPYGVFMVLGKEFRGFHVRFRDIARGGIRIVKSRDAENYDQNSDFIFEKFPDFSSVVC